MLAPTPFVHQVNIRLQQCCVVLVGVYLATPVLCWQFWCFLPGSWHGITGRHGTVVLWAEGACAVMPHSVEQQGKEDTLCLLRVAPRRRSSRPYSPAITSLELQPCNARLASPNLGPDGQGWA